jgi:RimJ/RimL family protein N-acetyltransferase
MCAVSIKIDAEITLIRLTEDMAEDLAYLADDRSIWMQLRDSMPFPYDYHDALGFIRSVAGETPPQTFGILFHGKLAGVCALISGKDVYRKTAEIGYWVGTVYRRKRVALRALHRLVEMAFRERGFDKIKASVFSENTASQALLIKLGFHEEAVLKREIIKAGKVHDEKRFALFREQFAGVDRNGLFCTDL